MPSLRHLTLSLLLTLAAAKTDYSGCTSFTSTVIFTDRVGSNYETVIYYDPSNLEICQGVDCGGGRAPPRTVPGCPRYSGTDTVTPKFLASDPLAPSTTMTTADAGKTTSADAGATETDTGTKTGTDVPKETGSGVAAGNGTATAGSTGSSTTDSASQKSGEIVDANGAGKTGFGFALSAIFGVVIVAVMGQT